MYDFSRFFDIEPDTKRSYWVVERCSGPMNTINAIVPLGFERYARIFHPGWRFDALSPNDKESWDAIRAGWSDAEHSTPVPWKEVAASNNVNLDRLMKWPLICSSSGREPGLAGIDPPLEGELTPEIVLSLFDILISHSGEDTEVICGFWEGYNRPELRGAKAKYESFLGQQNYLLFKSTLARTRDGWLAAFDNAATHHSNETVGLAPNAIFPVTKEWYLAVPYNLQSSYIGGSDELVNRVLSSSIVEAVGALPGDSIF